MKRHATTIDQWVAIGHNVFRYVNCKPMAVVDFDNDLELMLGSRLKCLAGDQYRSKYIVS